MSSNKIRCLIVDDSPIFRKVVRNVLEVIPDVEVVGMASNGKIALQMVATLKPHIVTLDLEMPEMDGLDVLKELKTRGDKASVIMVSAFTTRGAKATNEALRYGAFDFILKPNTRSLQMSVEQLRDDLAPKIAAVRARIEKPHARPAQPAARAKPQRPALPTSRRVFQRPDVVAIGVSTGGPQALSRLMPRLDANFPAPIVLVQHMPPMFTKSLAEELDRQCPLRVVEASAGQALRRGEVLIAPGGKQMRVVKSAAGAMAQITDDPPERNCKPSVDYLFRSVAQLYGPRSLGVVLTGMGDDGTLGAKALKQAGARVIAQDEASCVVYGMPKSVVDNGLADLVAPLDKVHETILASAQGRVAV